MTCIVILVGVVMFYKAYKDIFAALPSVVNKAVNDVNKEEKEKKND